MSKTTTANRVAVIRCLNEGNSINGTTRLTGVSKPTILKLLRDLGCACARYHDEHVRGLKPARVECDEIWSFNFCKQKSVSNTKLRDISYGDSWLWTSIDADSKLFISYLIGLRTPQDAMAFMDDLSGRVINIGTLCTDGYRGYPPAVRAAFGREVPYAQLIKVFREDRKSEARYSPATCVGCEKKSVIGFPHADAISTSIVERSNLTLRMQQKRFARLTNGHSKKIENHGHAVSLYVMNYNYVRPHMSLGGKTPAMASGLADHRWSTEELVKLID